MDGQNLKTRGRNPNPTAQAQSKHCLPLSTETQNIIGNVSLLASILGAFFKAFPQKWREGSRTTPQSAHKTPTWTPRVPKWSPRVPKSAQKTFTTIHQVCQNGSPRCHNGAPRPPKVPKRHHKALQSGTKTITGANDKQN